MREKWQQDKYQAAIVRQTCLHPVTGQPCLKVGNEEPLKAAYSDASKRVASAQWGIGRYLYPYASKAPREGIDEHEGTDDTPESKQAANSLIETTKDPKGEKKATTAEVNAAKAAINRAASELNTEVVDVLKRALKELAIDTGGKGWGGVTTNDCTSLTTWSRAPVGVKA